VQPRGTERQPELTTGLPKVAGGLSIPPGVVVATEAWPMRRCADRDDRLNEGQPPGG
jgi:hypothetical protein